MYKLKTGFKITNDVVCFDNTQAKNILLTGKYVINLNFLRLYHVAQKAAVSYKIHLIFGNSGIATHTSKSYAKNKYTTKVQKHST